MKGQKTDLKPESPEEPMEMVLKDEEQFHDETTGSLLYKPCTEQLVKLRKGTQPFVDIGSCKTEFTANSFGDWRHCLNLNEVLDLMCKKNREDAWKILEDKLKDEPLQGVEWINKATPKYQMKSPFDFRFGTSKMFFRLFHMVKRLNPTLKIENPHAGVLHRGGRRVRKFKNKRL